MAKANNEIAFLVSSANTGYFYSFSKKKKGVTEKIKVKKYDPVARKHVLFEEKKLSKVKK